MDLEMTGLDIERDTILEIACIITDSQLNIIAEGPDIIIHQDKSVLDNMNPWCIDNHEKVNIYSFFFRTNINLKLIF